MTPHSPEKSAAERARELQARLDTWEDFEADDEEKRDCAACSLTIGAPEPGDERSPLCRECLWKYFYALLADVPKLLQDLAAATERAERAEKERADAKAATTFAIETLKRVTHERDVAQSELTISRAAMDRTRQDADAQLSWIGIARPVVEAVRAYQVAYQNHMAHYEGSLDEHMKTFNESIAALHALREITLPLPPKETTT